jgi:hypothetical protein
MLLDFKTLAALCLGAAVLSGYATWLLASREHEGVTRFSLSEPVRLVLLAVSALVFVVSLAALASLLR